MRKGIRGSAGTASSAPPNQSNQITGNPATVEACAADYAQRNAAQIGTNPRNEQQGQTRTNGNAAGGFWRGRRR